MSNILRKPIRLIIKKILVVAIGVYLITGVLLFAFQEHMVFLPTKLPQDYEYDFSLPFKELFLNTDGGTINALHFKVNEPKGVIIYFHGNSGDLSRWGNVAKTFIPFNYDVLVVDYRTFGKSKGELSEIAFYKDAQHCYDYLLQHYSDKDIIVYGRSIGTGVAAYVASKNKPSHLILETPYHSISDLAELRFPIFPFKSLLKYKFPTYQFIKDVECPITIFHGKLDEVVPFSSAEKLYNSTKSETLNFVIFENGNHNNLSTFPKYQEHLKKILTPDS